jgi:O-antigen/teichoic acid export membrane protein
MSENNLCSKTPHATTVRHLVGLAITYALGEVFTKGFNYLLLPIYLQYLPPAEYGIIGITEILRTVLGLLLSFGMTSAILRFTNVIKEDEQRELFGTIWLFLLLTAGTTTLLLLAFGPPFFHWILPSIPFDPFLRKTLITAFLASSFALLPAPLFQARDQAKPFVIFGIFSTLSIGAATIVHVVILKQEAEGWVQAQLEGMIVIAVISAIILFRKVRFRILWKHLGAILVFSFPLVPHLLSHWILAASDRFILEKHVTLIDLGLYTLGYQFGQGYQVLITGINNAFIPLFGRASKEAHEYARLPRMTTYYLLGVSASALLIALIGEDIIHILFPSNYQNATHVVPWVILGYFALAVYLIPMNFLSMTSGKTKAVPLATLMAAGVNIILNLVFIPQFGILAAAVNTAIGYGVLAVCISIIAAKVGSIPIERNRVGKLVLTICAIYLTGSLLLRFSPFVNIALGLFLLIGLPFALASVRFWYPEEEDEIRRVVHRLSRRGSND